jgi:Adenylylsulphate kinase
VEEVRESVVAVQIKDGTAPQFDEFIEVYVDTHVATCELRHPKELYRKARSGEIRAFTGIDDLYEPPLKAEVVCNTEHQSVRQSSQKVVEAALRDLSSRVARHDTVPTLLTLEAPRKARPWIRSWSPGVLLLAC